MLILPRLVCLITWTIFRLDWIYFIVKLFFIIEISSCMAYLSVAVISLWIWKFFFAFHFVNIIRDVHFSYITQVNWINLFTQRLTQISTCPGANKQGRVKCRHHVPFQRYQHREQSRRRADNKKKKKNHPWMAINLSQTYLSSLHEQISRWNPDSPIFVREPSWLLPIDFLAR